MNKMIDATPEIKFKTARSGGKGGQNVNKVETMVEGYWHVESSGLLSNEHKVILLHKLSKKISSEGFLQVKSQVYRSQLHNKEEVVRKLNKLVATALIKIKKRIATKPTKASQRIRVEDKKKGSEVKTGRKKIRLTD